MVNSNVLQGMFKCVPCSALVPIHFMVHSEELRVTHNPKECIIHTCTTLISW